jgi:hypothetical protein
MRENEENKTLQTFILIIHQSDIDSSFSFYTWVDVLDQGHDVSSNTTIFLFHHSWGIFQGKIMCLYVDDISSDI